MACYGNISRRAVIFPRTAPTTSTGVAAELNDRPRKRLGFKKPIEQIGPLLLR
jgi:IS30 family transposase